MIFQTEIVLNPHPRGFHLITDKVVQSIPVFPKTGILHLFICHTSAGLTINENADPTVRMDFETVFNQLVPEGNSKYRHDFEGEDDLPAHIKSTLSGSSISIPITNGSLNMGIWQGVYLCEFRNKGGRRKLICTVTGE